MFRKVDHQRGVGRVGGDEEAPVRLTTTRREQSDLGMEEAVYGKEGNK